MKQIILTLGLSAALAANATTYYVSTDGNDANDGTSWATAFATPRQAVNVAYQKGDTVVLSNGTYQVSETLNPGNYTKPWLHLRSFSLNPEDVVLDGGGTTQILRFGVDAGRKCVIEGLTFRNGRATGADEGGAIRFGVGTYFTSPLLGENVVSNCVFLNCHNDTYIGGAILVGGSDTVVDCVFSNCTAMTKGDSSQNGGTLGGGAIYAGCFAGDIAITRCTFVECGASNGVGVVAAGLPYKASLSPLNTNGFSVVMTDCSFTNNWSYGLQAICCNYKARRVTGCTFSGNRSESAGLFGTCESRSLNSPGETNVYADCVFEDNVSAGWTAILRHDGDIPFVFSNCAFRRNSGGGKFASLLVANGYTEFSGCTVEANSTTHLHDSGGALYEEYGLVNLRGTSRPALFRNTVFDGNVSCGSGGIVAVKAPGSEVENCTFSRNLVTRNGQGVPAVLALLGAANDVAVRGCLFACNTNDNTMAPQQVFIGPSSASGGRYLGGTNAVVENCTFVGNRSKLTNWNTATAGIVHVGDSGGTASIVNCAFYDNRSTATTAFRNFSDASAYGVQTHLLARYCWEDGSQIRVAPSYPEYHNTRGSNPRFADVDNGDYRPASGSPLGNAGVLLPWMQGAVDLAGVPRVQVGGVDIGCYERPDLRFILFVR